MSTMNDVIIIGGGIIGMLTARECAQAGMQVVLIERTTTGQEASWAGGGILSPLLPWQTPPTLMPLVQWSQAAYPVLAQALYEETGVDCQWQQCGLLHITDEPCSKALSWAMRYAYPLEIIQAEQIKAHEPQVHMLPSQQAVYVPHISQIRNPRLLKALRMTLQQSDRVSLIENTTVNTILVNRNRVIGVATADERIDAARVIVCAGAWSEALLRPLGLTVAIHPMKGQMLAFAAQPNLIRCIIGAGDQYLIPRCDGIILVGSTVEQVGFCKSCTPQAYDHLYHFATQFCPQLQQARVVKHWAGLRPASARGLAIIDCIAHIDGLAINAGHYRNGLGLAPGAARLIVDLMLKRPPCVDAKPFRWQSSNQNLSSPHRMACSRYPENVKNAGRLIKQ